MFDKLVRWISGIVFSKSSSRKAISVNNRYAVLRNTKDQFALSELVIGES